MRVLAIDFETANASPASACSVGYGLMDQGEVLRTAEILIRPMPRYGYFLRGNMQIHHITPQMVADADRWPEVFFQIKDLFRDSVVVAHNARFDMTVLRALNTVYGIDMDDFVFLDTVSLSRITHPELVNHKLNTVADGLGIDLNHHHSGSDAFACLAIVADAMDQYGCYDIEQLMAEMYLHGSPYSAVKVSEI
jgi:DNA polymerase-3 subunit epsilon